jgi:hypothetical protein
MRIIFLNDGGQKQEFYSRQALAEFTGLCHPSPELPVIITQYAEDPKDHNQFQGMFCVSPLVFQVILELIQDHKVFQNNLNTPQTPVDI